MIIFREGLMMVMQSKDSLMKIKWTAVVMLALALSGCESVGSGTKKGAGIGALGGAALGGIIGHQSGHGWEGALIGGAAGAAGGGLVGNRMDKKREAEQGDAYLSLMEIAKMGHDGVPDEVIISEIKRTKSRYDLDSKTIAYLKENKVGDRVIDYMLADHRP